jgi:murein peptide amidase A
MKVFPTKINWQPVAMQHSQEGREIPLYLSRPNTSEPIDTLIIGGMHGDEPESKTLAEKLMARLRPRELQDKVVGIIPLLNPDGMARNQRGNTNGVDINRNFPEAWIPMEKMMEIQGLKSPPVTYNPGPAPASELETQFLIQVIQQFRPKKIVAVHQPYKVINYDGPAEGLAKEMAKANNYPVKASIGYPTPGSFGTYAGVKNRIPTITLELPDGTLSLRQTQKNIKALKAAITGEN